MSKDWIQGVEKEMKRKGTVGAFTKQAKRAGMSVHDFAMKVKNNPKDFSDRTRKRANLALTFEKLADRKKKYMHGGKTQGYNSQLDESLATRLAPERKYKQSMKDRRDESKAANKRLGRRAYSSVRAMDKGDRMMKHGGKVHRQGYDDKQNESLGMRTGAESTKKQSYKARRDDSYGKWGKRDEENRKISMARGGSLKDPEVREPESSEEDPQIVRYYFEDEAFEYKRGGSVKGKIDRDRYVKLQREKKKEIAKLKKEKGALRKKKQECKDEVGELKKDMGNLEYYAKKRTDKGKKDEKQTMLLSGIAGILMGAFLSR